MEKILIKVDGECLIFSLYKRDINKSNLNNTNIINTKSLKFTEEYILNNLELVTSFFNLIILKNKISKVVINNLEIAETVLKFIKELNSISMIYFKEDKPLNYTLSNLLLINKNIIFVNCFSMPEYMIVRFNNTQIKLRCEMLFISDFMKDNSLNTFTRIYYKKKLILDGNYSREDLNDIEEFIKINKSLKQVDIKNYNRDFLISFLNKLQKYNIKGISISIIESNNSKLLLRDVDYLKKVSNQYKVVIRIKYSNEYKIKNLIKQINFTIVKFILGSLIIISIIILGINKYREIYDSNKIEEVNDEIEEVLDDTSEDVSYEDNDIYHTSFDSTFSKLLELNPDTIGWIKVNNTNINYPVVQTIDNEYYLKHAFDKSKNNAGWVFLDFRNSIKNLSKNTVLYGHRIRNGELMFGSLNRVIKSSWYNNPDNLVITFNTLNEDIKWQIFSIYTIDVTSDYLVVNFEDDNAFNNFINTSKSRSIHNFDVDVNSVDQILTLSTCYANSTKRIVVQAKRI